MKKRFSEEQILGFLQAADRGVPVKELCRKRGFSEASFYLWRSKYHATSARNLVNHPRLITTLSVPMSVHARS